MITTVFSHELDNAPRPVACTWDELAEFLTTVEPVACTLASCPRGNKCSEKKTHGAWCPASWPEGATRAKSTVVEVSCFVVDLDHLSDAELDGCLERLGHLSYVMQGSHSDRPGDRCVRVAIEPSRPIPGPDFARFWVQAMTELGLLDVADSTCRNADRLYFFPTRPSDMCEELSDGSGFDSEIHPGTPLDVDDVLSRAAPRVECDVKPAKIPAFRGAPSEEAFRAASEALGRAWPPEGKRHRVQLALAGALARVGWPVELVADFCAAVAEVAQPGSGELDKRLAAARSSADKLAAGELVGGWPKVLEEVAEEAVEEARRVLGMGLVGIPDTLRETLNRRAREAAVRETERQKDAQRAVESAIRERGAQVRGPGLPTRDDLDADLELAVAACKKSREADRRVDGKLISKVLKNLPLSSHSDEDLRESLVRAAVAVARAFRPGATAAQVAEYLLPSASYLAPEVREIAEFGLAQAAEAGPLPVSSPRARELPEERGEPGDDDELRAQLELTKDGDARNCGANLERVLTYASELRGVLRFNVVTKRVEVTDGRFLGDDPNILPVAVMSWLGSHWSLHTSADKVAEMILLVAKKLNSYDPILDYLVPLEWDRVPRVGGSNATSWLTTYCGADDTPYTRKIGARFLLSAVARGMEPGCKVDTVLVLEGAQGAYKSTTLRILGSPWFSDTTLVLGDKDACMVAGTKWIVELPELAGLSKGEFNKYKAFLSSPVDNFRPPYGHAMEEFPRRCVFAGSVNEDEYLEDRTGNRRWWAARIRRCLVEELRRDRDQLWAEAVYRYRTAELHPEETHAGAPGERWWFEEWEQPEADEVARRRTVEDPWIQMIREWADRQLRPAGAQKPATHFTMGRVAEEALQLSRSDARRHSKSIAKSLREAGFRCDDTRVESGNKRLWCRAGTVVMERQSEPTVTEGVSGEASPLN